MKHKILFPFLFSVALLVAQNKNQSVGFKENKGQIVDQNGKPNPDVKYLLNTNGLNVQIKKNGFSYDVYEAKQHPMTEKEQKKRRPTAFPDQDTKKTPDYSLEFIYHRIDIDFVNSNPKVQLITEQKSKDYDNYYNIPNKPEGVLMVHQYQQITYKNIYPNIDVVFSIPKDSLKAVEYNFVVHPKGKISDIQMKFKGAKTDLIDNKIRMNVRFGAMEETLPMSWTEDGKDKKEIAVGYTKIKKNVYGFESAENVSGKTVVIDPVPTRLWGTFYGDSRNTIYVLNDASLATDSVGNSYLCGSTTARETAYATVGSHQTTVFSNSSTNGIIVKFDANGKRLWGSYFGGENNTVINAVKSDSKNNIIVTGYTSSYSNISTSGSYKPNVSGVLDSFLVKFNHLGVRIWGTYFGGESIDYASALDIDKNDNIYIVGTTTSKTNIAINSNFQMQFNAGSIEVDGFLAKFRFDGNLLWSTYVGGEDRDELEAIVVKDNYLITGGFTNSFTNISTIGVFQENLNLTKHEDGVVYKFSLNGQRIWATYYGGEYTDYVYTVETDNDDNVYLGGETGSSTNMTTPGCFDSQRQVFSGFFAKLDTNGRRIWGSYLTGTEVYSIIFKNNAIYLGATTNSTNITNLTTACAYIPNNNYSQGYIGKFSKQGSFIWGTFVGGNSTFQTTRIAFDNSNSIFVGGISRQADGIADSNSYQSSVLGSSNYFLMKFTEESTTSGLPIPESNSPICIGNTIELKASGGTAYAWTGPNGFTSTNQNPTILNATTANTGKYSCSITGTGGCDGVVDVDVFVGDNQPPLPNIVILPTITGDCKTQITTIPTATDACAGAITATTTNPLSYSLAGTYTIVWKYDDGNGNSVTQNQTVVISAQPLPTVTSPHTFCTQQNATLSSIVINGENLKWYDAAINGNLLANTTLVQNGISYYASQTINGCESDRIPVIINIQNTATPTGSSPQTFCASQNPTLDTLVISGTAIKWYDSLTFGNVLVNTTLLQNGKTYYAVQTLNGCESPTRLAVTVALIATLPANNFVELFCDDLNDGTETVDLNGYNAKIISNPTPYTFSYYESRSGAENETAKDRITNPSNYKLVVGDNKVLVRINSNTPCYAVAELKLTLFSKPIINIPDVVPICDNNTVTVNAGAGFDSYLWSNGATNASTTIATAGNYNVTVTQNHGSLVCSSMKNFKVVLSNVATITAIETRDWSDNENIIIANIASSSVGDYEYSIDGINYQTSNQFTGLFSGKYRVSVRDKNNCGTVQSDELYLLMFPRYFTPNGDGFHDTWKIKFSDIETGLTVKIFDRYGKLIKNLSNNADSWDGTFNGNNLPATDYWFVVSRGNGLEYKGHFSLKR